MLSLISAIGLGLGKVRFGGISLGVTFVFFVGILAGHLGLSIDPQMLNYAESFGLVLFVYALGLQVGPGFFASFRTGGLKMNMLAVVMVLLDVTVMLGLYYLFFDTSDPTALPMMVGVLNGAVTNTPGLGAASSTLSSFFAENQIPPIASGYACAYPLGVLGIIGATIAIRYICRVSPEQEEADIQRAHEEDPHAKPCHLVLRVKNTAFVGKKLREVRGFLNRDFVCTRYVKNGEMGVAGPDLVLELDMDLYIVCAEAEAEAVTVMIGESLDIDWKAAIAKSNRPTA